MSEPQFGMPVVYSLNAARVTLHWPERKRSKRLHKKLTKLRGPQKTYEPAIYTYGRTIVAHPAFRGKIEAATRPATEVKP